MSVAHPSPASTIVLLRAATAGPPETLLLRRQHRSSWLGGTWVFPGGRVDDGDREPAWEQLALGHRALFDAWPQADRPWLCDHAVAALRELFEETGLLLADTVTDVREGEEVLRAGPGRSADERRQLLDGLASFASTCERRRWRIRLDRLVPFVRWITPESERRRFDTVFFACEADLTPLDAHAGATHAGEMSDHAWLAPADAVARFDRGEMALAPPTLRTLEDLAPLDSLEDALAWVRTVPRAVIAPRLVEDGPNRWLVLPGDDLYPAGESAGTPMAGPTRFVFDNGRWRSAR